MPKEKVTRGKGKASKADGGKKKKGELLTRTAFRNITDSSTDPNAPKRGLSAYMFFANEQRENVRDENPGISFGQVGKILGERWKALNDKQRAPYEAKAAADKKRYEDEKAAYQVSLLVPMHDLTMTALSVANRLLIPIRLVAMMMTMKSKFSEVFFSFTASGLQGFTMR